jgi:hypothetical protein
MVELKLALSDMFNSLNTELNLICYLLALLGAHLIFHVSSIRVKCGRNGKEFWGRILQNFGT